MTPLQSRIAGIRQALEHGLPSEGAVGFVCGQLFQLEQQVTDLEREGAGRRSTTSSDAGSSWSLDSSGDLRVDDARRERTAGGERPVGQPSQFPPYQPPVDGSRPRPSREDYEEYSEYDVPAPSDLYEDDFHLNKLDVLRLQVATLDLSSEEASQNSFFLLNNQLQALPPLLDVARGLRPATHLADSKLRAIVMKFISTCPQVVTDVRTRFGNSGGSGAEILDHVQHFWVEHLENDENDAEQDLNDFEWTAVFSGKARELQAKMQQFFEIVSRLPYSKSPEKWIEYIRDRLPPALAMEVQNTIATMAPHHQHGAMHDTQQYVVALMTARNAELRRKSRAARTSTDVPQSFQHGQPTPPPPQQEEERPRCDDCKLSGCPRAYDAGKVCDVLGDPSEARIKQIQDKKYYRPRLDKKREMEKRPPLAYPKSSPHTNVHAADECPTCEDPWLKDFRELAEQFGLEGDLTLR